MCDYNTIIDQVENLEDGETVTLERCGGTNVVSREGDSVHITVEVDGMHHEDDMGYQEMVEAFKEIQQEHDFLVQLQALFEDADVRPLFAE